MTYTNYLSYVNEIATYPNPENYAMDYGFPADCPVNGDSIITMFQIIWAVTHNDFAELIKTVNMTAYRLSKLLNISPRTAAHWVNGDRTPPKYVIELLGFALISELPKNEE